MEERSAQFGAKERLAQFKANYRRSLAESESFWLEQANRLSWFHWPTAALEGGYESKHEGEFSWFPGGRLNAAYNCVDRHAAVAPEKVALLWAKNTPGEYENITFRQLQNRVGKLANVLRAMGVRRGDRVCLYLPMMPELCYAMLACARIGAIHSVVFAGFSAEALRDRVVDCGAEVVITADEGLRGAKTIPLKSIVDEAMAALPQVRAVLVAQRTGASVSMIQGRDRYLAEAMGEQRATCPAEWMDGEDPLFILYTSGSTGRPKGVLHTTAGYLLYAALTHSQVFDLRPDDVHFCAADIGWITGHSYIVYGPLCNGVTTVLFESTPLHPDAGRYWQVVDDIRATIFYTSPTALRALMREGDEPVRAHSRRSLRVLGTVGEPINPEVWRWYHEVVGERRSPVVDTWWQTETGGVMIAPVAGVVPPKPGSATLPLYGVEPVLVDEQGAVLEGPAEGKLCLARPWPGQARTLWGDDPRFRETYFSTFPGLYFTGDGCRRDEDGYYWITGRVDDVLNVSGHRLGTAEIESALVAHDAVAEAAVVPIEHEIKGQAIYAYVVLRAGVEDSEDALVGALKERVNRSIGAIARPEVIRIVGSLPKTRSGKIMRRVLRKIASGQLDSLGDLSTLADPAVVQALLSDGEA